MDPIRVGVIGANPERGWASRSHLPALAGLPDLRLVAVATTRPDTAAAAAERWGARYAFADSRELIEHPEVDLVTVAVRLPHHRALVEAVLAAGKHVYCEWPLDVDAASAARLRDLAEDAGVRHAVGLQGRHNPAVRHVRELVARGEIGEILSSTLTYSLPAPPSDRPPGVNTLTISAAHALDVQRHVLGEFRELSATLALTVSEPDQVVVQGVLNSGAVASAQILSGAPTGSGLRWEIYGRTGRLTVTAASSLAGSALLVAVARGNGELIDSPVPAGYRTVLPDAAPMVRNVAACYAGLATAIRAGRPAEPDFGTATTLHQLLETITEAAETGRRQSAQPSTSPAR